MTDYELVLRGEIGDHFGLAVRRHAPGARAGDDRPPRRGARPGPAARPHRADPGARPRADLRQPDSERTDERTRHDRADPRLLGHPAQLGGLDRPLRGARLHASSRPPTRASRSRSRRSTPTRRRSRRSPCRRSSSTWRRSSAALDDAADPDRPLGRRRVHADPARPRLRRRAASRSTRRPTEGVKRVPLSQIRATFPVLKNPANRHRAVGFTPGAVALRVHEHVQRGGVAARSTSATTSPPRARSSGAARWPTSTRARTTTTSTTTTTTARRCCSSPAARTT